MNQPIELLNLPSRLIAKLRGGGMVNTDSLRVLTTRNLMTTFKLTDETIEKISAALIQAGQEPLPDPVERPTLVRRPNVPGHCRKLVGEASQSCGREKYANKASCVWHWLANQPIADQLAMADRRLAAERQLQSPYRTRVPEREWPAGERWCSGCQSFIPLFYCQGSRCHACSSRAAHGAMIARVYDLTPEQYDALLAWQHGRCYMCQRLPRSKRLAVDHDHNTGAVRGLLCADDERGCNRAILGNIRSLAMARRIVAYLEKTPMERIADSEPRPALDNTRRDIVAPASLFVDQTPALGLRTIGTVFDNFL